MHYGKKDLWLLIIVGFLLMVPALKGGIILIIPLVVIPLWDLQVQLMKEING